MKGRPSCRPQASKRPNGHHRTMDAARRWLPPLHYLDQYTLSTVIRLVTLLPWGLPVTP